MENIVDSQQMLEEMTFVDIKDKQNNVTYSAVDQQEDFWNYVNNDSYLNDHKGQYVERASSLEAGTYIKSE
jgi:hypothetical protein